MPRDSNGRASNLPIPDHQPGLPAHWQAPSLISTLASGFELDMQRLLANKQTAATRAFTAGFEAQDAAAQAYIKLQSTLACLRDHDNTLAEEHREREEQRTAAAAQRQQAALQRAADLEALTARLAFERGQRTLQHQATLTMKEKQLAETQRQRIIAEFKSLVEKELEQLKRTRMFELYTKTALEAALERIIVASDVNAQQSGTAGAAQPAAKTINQFLIQEIDAEIENARQRNEPDNVVQALLRLRAQRSAARDETT